MHRRAVSEKARRLGEPRANLLSMRRADMVTHERDHGEALVDLLV
jgi:hypothetical protein